MCLQKPKFPVHSVNERVGGAVSRRIYTRQANQRRESVTKKIEAFIREEKFEEVKQALYDIGIVGMNVVEVHGHGRQGGVTLAWRTGTYKVDMLPKFQLN